MLPIMAVHERLVRAQVERFADEFRDAVLPSPGRGVPKDAYARAARFARERGLPFRVVEEILGSLCQKGAPLLEALDGWRRQGRAELAESCDRTFVEAAHEHLRGTPPGDLQGPLLALFRGLDTDDAAAPLPFELVRALLAEMEPRDARSLVVAAQRLDLWTEQERSWLGFQRLRIEEEAGERDEDFLRTHLVPIARRLCSEASSEPGRRAWAACWLIERTRNSTPNSAVLALVGASPAATRPGHYARRLRLWADHRGVVGPALDGAVPGLIDAWALLGDDRLPDRAAVATLLALAPTAPSPVARSRFRAEAASLATSLPDRDKSAVLGALEMVPDLALQPEATPLADADPEALRLLRARRALEAFHLLKSRPASSDPDERLRRAVLLAEAARRSRSTKVAMEALREVSTPPAGARPDLAWAFHYSRAAIHWGRGESHSSLEALNAALRFCGYAASIRLLHATHMFRQRCAYRLYLNDTTKLESDRVLAALARVAPSVAGAEQAYPETVLIGEALGIRTGPTAYGEAIDALRSLRKSWEGGSLPNHEEFGERLRAIADKCDAAALDPEQEPFLTAQLDFDRAQLALSARMSWRDNGELYRSGMKAQLERALSTTERMEHHRLFDTVVDSIRRMHREEVLDRHLVPVRLRDPRDSQRVELAQAGRLLSATRTRLERRRILRSAHRLYGKFLTRQPRGGAWDYEEKALLLDLLQSLKQPSLDELIGDDGDARPFPERDDAFPADAEESQDAGPADWKRAVAARLRRENAVCLDLFLNNDGLYGFSLAEKGGALAIGLHALIRPASGGDLREVANVWRRDFGEAIPGAVTPEDMKHSILRLRTLRDDRPNMPIAAALKRALGDRHPKTLYVAPMSGLHGLPLHALLSAGREWSAQDCSVVHLSKARQLASPSPGAVAKARFIAGDDPAFRDAAKTLAETCNGELLTPRCHRDLRDALHKNADGFLTVLIAHGTVDKDYPIRSRVRLGEGLNLTVRDIQQLGLEGREIVLLSCWGGWSTQGRQPLGELIGGPSSWMAGGAGAVLAPLWYVPAEASMRFVADYVSARMNRERRTAAIRIARLKAAKYKYGSVCSTAFVLWGSDAP